MQVLGTLFILLYLVLAALVMAPWFWQSLVWVWRRIIGKQDPKFHVERRVLEPNNIVEAKDPKNMCGSDNAIREVKTMPRCFECKEEQFAAGVIQDEGILLCPKCDARRQQVVAAPAALARLPGDDAGIVCDTCRRLMDSRMVNKYHEKWLCEYCAKKAGESLPHARGYLYGAIANPVGLGTAVATPPAAPKREPVPWIGMMIFVVVVAVLVSLGAAVFIPVLLVLWVMRVVVILCRGGGISGGGVVGILRIVGAIFGLK